MSRGSKAFLWVVACFLSLRLVHAQVQTAGELFVDLDAGDLPVGPAPATWTNNGTLGDFVLVEGSAPVVEEIGGVTAITFDGTLPDAYQQPEESAPAGLVGENPTRSVEAWALNPEVDAEETIVAWGFRGGPDGTNFSLNYGNHGTWGAITQWGAGDVNWGDIDTPLPGQWHHLAYTFDGTTTVVYVDGVQTNSIDQTINTHPEGKITVGAQIADETITTLNLGGSLSVARLRVHDEALTAEQVASNFNEEVPDFFGPPFFARIPAADEVFATADTYTERIVVGGLPAPEVTLIAPAAAILEPTGAPGTYDLTYDLPSPLTDPFDVTIELENDFGTIQGTWTVTILEAPPCPGEGLFFCAGELLVWLDADDPTAGTEIWANGGTLSDFVEVGDVIVEDVEINTPGGIVTVRGVTPNPPGVGETFDIYESVEEPPATLVGEDATASIEAWTILRGPLQDSPTIVSWAPRLGQDGTNMSFNYGFNGAYGAVTHWGAPDLGWSEPPEPNQWHYMAYTFDGFTQRVYLDGVEDNFEELGPGVLNIANEPTTKITVGAQREADGINFTIPAEDISIAILRIHSDPLTAEQISSNYFEEVDRFPRNAFVPRAVFVPESAFVYVGTMEYTASVLIEALPSDVLFEMQDPPGAVVDLDGNITAPVPEPNQAGSFEVVLLATNSEGTTEFRWTVEVRELPTPGSGIQTDGELIVDLDASDASAGTELWVNRATGPNSVGDFEVGGINPAPIADIVDGVPAVTLNASNLALDAYVSQGTAPPGLIGPNPTSTVEAWAYNEEIGAQEFIVSLARNSVPPGSTAHYGYGTGGGGAIDRWGFTSIEWAEVPVEAQWHHLAYTFDGQTTRVYADGVLSAEEEVGFGNVNIVGDGLPINIGAARDGNLTDLIIGTRFSGSVARVRVHDGVLQPEQVLHNYNEELAEFTGGGGGFRRGDSNANGTLDIGDPILNLGHQFLGDDVVCRDALDFNDSGTIDLTDPIANLGHQFLGSAPPEAPGKEQCGPDPTDDDGIDCAAYPQENC